MQDKFELGREYEKTNRNKNFNLLVGYALILFGGFWFFSKLIIKDNSFWHELIALGIGIMFLYAGHLEKKELKKLKEKLKL